jgi:hypothetical protein
LNTKQTNNGRSGIPTNLFKDLKLDGDIATVSLSLPLQGVGMSTDYQCTALLSPGYESLDDLKPQSGDLVGFSFRLLSASYLGAGGYHLDFSQTDVLKRALSLFQDPDEEGSMRQNALVVVRDHSMQIEDRLGLVQNARWNEATDDDDPGGIEAELLINWKLAGDIVRRLLHIPPLLDSCSVGLSFNWEKSHPELEDWQFWMHLGEEIDDSCVRVIVTDILAVEHVGLVYAGADPSAKRYDGAQSTDLDRVASTALAGAVNGEIGQAQLGPDSLVWELTGVSYPDVSALVSQVGQLCKLAEIGDTSITHLRNEVRAMVLRLEGALDRHLSEGLTAVIDQSDLATLTALRDSYARRLEETLPATCHDCGSQHISRRSSRELPMTFDKNRSPQPNPIYYE